MSRDSDLIGIPFATGLIIAVLAVFAAYFFIGPVVGTVVLVAVIVLAAALAVRFIRRNELG